MDKSLLAGSTTVLILKLLEDQDMYGYQMISSLAERSNHTFDLKAGTLYPLLHNLEKNGIVESYEKIAENERTRKYYHLTRNGKMVCIFQRGQQCFKRGIMLCRMTKL